MVRIGNLFEKIIDIDNIRLAHKNASKGKSKYKEVIIINKNIDFYCYKIQKMLSDDTYKTSEYKMKQKNDKGKLRDIYVLPYFPDRIIHHTIMQVLEPIWKTLLIKNTYQSIKGRGVHKCKLDVEKVTKRKDLETLYCYKIDVRKFYPSINNLILKQIISKKIKCKRTLSLIYNIIDSTEGVPIGNYISQYFGNLYLAYFDHYMKEELKCKWYYRYCDDIVVISTDKIFLHSIKDKVKLYLNNKLKLDIKQNYQIFKVGKRPIDFVGYQFYLGYTLLRKSITKAYLLSIKENKDNISSYYGWLKHCNGFNLWIKYNNRSDNNESYRKCTTSPYSKTG